MTKRLEKSATIDRRPRRWDVEGEALGHYRDRSENRYDHGVGGISGTPAGAVRLRSRLARRRMMHRTRRMVAPVCARACDGRRVLCGFQAEHNRRGRNADDLTANPHRRHPSQRAPQSDQQSLTIRRLPHRVKPGDHQNPTMTLTRAVRGIVGGDECRQCRAARRPAARRRRVDVAVSFPVASGQSL
jgi:hypothetical protein